MATPTEVQQFIQHWEQVTLNEKAVAQSHFNALCALLGLKGPVESDPTGQFFRFEKPLTKAGGAAGFADVWYKDRFAVEYKTKGKYATLREAYLQLLLYKDDLDNPPILIACDLAHYEIHVAFTGYPSRVHAFTNRDLENASVRDLLRRALTAPESLRPVEQADTITKTVAASFAKIAQLLEGRGFAPTVIAHFFMKVLFALFAEDIQLLPAELMSTSIRRAILNPAEFPERARALFRAMREGGYFGADRVPRFNGWLFNDDEVLPLTADELTFLADAARHDWAAVEPAIFGTLFERSLDPTKRAQLGAHYTSREDILLIVEPVLMQPLRRQWAEVQAGVSALRDQWALLDGNAQRKLQSIAETMLLNFMEQLAAVRVLDPACGSGNFLYVALTALKDVEKAVWVYAGGIGVRQPELAVSPAQLFGIEKNPFAAELAQVVVWIGYLQWLKREGFLEGWPKEPVLKALHTIENRDAILTIDLDGQPAEPPWPEVDVIMGNPPFLGGNKVRKELGDTYVEALFALYKDRVPAFADLVCYWFERARAQLEQGQVQRVGLLATQGIRGGANRKVLERIKASGDIFLAWSDRKWYQDGAAVQVSMVGFDTGSEQERQRDGHVVATINADLTATVDLTTIQNLRENHGICFMGPSAKAPFDLDADSAGLMFSAPPNPNGRPNTDVVRPVASAIDLAQRNRGKWTIDFGLRSEDEAACYEAPFAYVRTHVYPVRMSEDRVKYAGNWWQYARPRVEMRTALAGKPRYIATPGVAKYRIFVWVRPEVLCNQGTLVFARDDDYFLGVLHAKPHELWARGTGTQLRDAESGSRYTPTTTFETYPFPWPPGSEPTDDARVHAIAAAARELVALREAWLNPHPPAPSPIKGEGEPEASYGEISPLPLWERGRGRGAKAEDALDGVKLSERTLTNLYNQRPDWLHAAHQRLDAAVCAAYGWPVDSSDEELLARLLALNLARAG